MTLEGSGLISGHPLPVLASRACISSVRTGDCHSPCYHRAFAHAVLSAWSTPCPTLISGHILQISATQTSQAPGYTSPNTQNFGSQISKLSREVASSSPFSGVHACRLLRLRKQRENQTPSQVDCPRPPSPGCQTHLPLGYHP